MFWRGPPYPGFHSSCWYLYCRRRLVYSRPRLPLQLLVPLLYTQASIQQTQASTLVVGTSTVDVGYKADPGFHSSCWYVYCTRRLVYSRPRLSLQLLVPLLYTQASIQQTQASTLVVGTFTVDLELQITVYLILMCMHTYSIIN